MNILNIFADYVKDYCTDGSAILPGESLKSVLKHKGNESEYEIAVDIVDKLVDGFSSDDCGMYYDKLHAIGMAPIYEGYLVVVFKIAHSPGMFVLHEESKSVYAFDESLAGLKSIQEFLHKSPAWSNNSINVLSKYMREQACCEKKHAQLHEYMRLIRLTDHDINAIADTIMRFLYRTYPDVLDNVAEMIRKDFK